MESLTDQFFLLTAVETFLHLLGLLLLPTQKCNELRLKAIFSGWWQLYLVLGYILLV